MIPAPLLLLPLLGWALALLAAGVRRVSAAVMWAVAAQIVVLYLGALVGWLRPTTWALALLGLAALGLALHRAELRARLRDPLLLGFAAAAAAHWLRFRHAEYGTWDELVQWGLSLKEMVLSHGLADANSNARAPVYVPGATLWQYSITSLAGYTEGNAYFAQFVLLVSPLLPLLERVRDAGRRWILPVGVALIVLLANLSLGFSSLCVDHVIATWTAGTVLVALDERPRGWRALPLALGGTTLVLVKDVGLFFAAGALGLGALLALLDARSEGGAGASGRRATPWILALVLPLALHLTWGPYLRHAGLRAETQGTGRAAAGLLSGQRTAQSAVIRERFWSVFWTARLGRPAVLCDHNEFSWELLAEYPADRRLSTAGYLALWLGLWAISVASLRDRSARARLAALGAGLAALAATYVALLAIGYQYFFDDWGVHIPSYDRYVHTLVLPLLLVLLAVQLPERPLRPRPRAGRDARYLAACAVVLAYALLEAPSARTLATLHEQAVDHPNRTRFVIPAVAALRRALPDGAAFLTIIPVADNGMLANLVRYELAPTRMLLGPGDLLERAPAQIVDALRGHDHVWIFPVDVRAGERLTALLGPPPPTPGVLYRIERHDGRVALTPVP